MPPKTSAPTSPTCLSCEEEDERNMQPKTSSPTCLSSKGEDERKMLPKTPSSSFPNSLLSIYSKEDEERPVGKMPTFNQEIEETLEQTNDSLRNKHLEEGDTVETRSEEHASNYTHLYLNPNNIIFKAKHSHNVPVLNTHTHVQYPYLSPSNIASHQWVINIENSITNNRRHPSISRCCIYRAQKLRDVDIAAFTPKIVSIGPLHYSDEHLKGMESTKIKYLEHFLLHASNTAKLNEQLGFMTKNDKLEFLCWKNIKQMETAKADFNCLVKFHSQVQSLEEEIRSCYAENLNHFAREEFLSLILVDAAFIIEIFLKVYFRRYGDNFLSGDNLLSTDFLFALLRCDLWLLENQLPFFVLQELYSSAFGSLPDIYPPFLDLTSLFFDRYNHQGKGIDPNKPVHHFTDLLRTFFLPRPVNSQNEEEATEYEGLSLILMFGPTEVLSKHLPNATQLHAAGVKFCATESKCLFDVKFSNGILEIPSLDLLHEDGVLFRNLIALEQYHYPKVTLVSNYFTFMDYLVDTSNDADLLVEKKIIKHWLGSGKEVATLFNSLCVGILKESINPHFDCLIKELNEYHDQPRHRWKATLKSQYFSTPWRSASTIAAIILLFLTLVQTILSGIAL